MELKLLFAAIAIALTFFAYVPYIREIFAGKTKPHVFSWLIWGTTTIIVFFAQIEAQGGIGAWVTGLSGVITIYIAILAVVKRADIKINRVDWLFLFAALSSLPIWYFTDSPLWAVVLLTVIDLMGFGPTFRKAYQDPESENRTFYLLFAIRNCFTLLALESYSITTILFPAAIGIACVFLLLVLHFRRQAVRQ